MEAGPSRSTRAPPTRFDLDTAEGRAAKSEHERKKAAEYSRRYRTRHTDTNPDGPKKRGRPRKNPVPLECDREPEPMPRDAAPSAVGLECRVSTANQTHNQTRHPDTKPDGPKRRGRPRKNPVSLECNREANPMPRDATSPAVGLEGTFPIANQTHNGTNQMLSNIVQNVSVSGSPATTPNAFAAGLNTVNVTINNQAPAFINYADIAQPAAPRPAHILSKRGSPESSLPKPTTQLWRSPRKHPTSNSSRHYSADRELRARRSQMERDYLDDAYRHHTMTSSRPPSYSPKRTALADGLQAFELDEVNKQNIRELQYAATRTDVNRRLQGNRGLQRSPQPREPSGANRLNASSNGFDPLRTEHASGLSRPNRLSCDRGQLGQDDEVFPTPPFQNPTGPLQNPTGQVDDNGNRRTGGAGFNETITGLVDEQEIAIGDTSSLYDSERSSDLGLPHTPNENAIHSSASTEDMIEVALPGLTGSVMSSPPHDNTGASPGSSNVSQYTPGQSLPASNPEEQTNPVAAYMLPTVTSDADDSDTSESSNGPAPSSIVNSANSVDWSWEPGTSDEASVKSSASDTSSREKVKSKAERSRSRKQNPRIEDVPFDTLVEKSERWLAERWKRRCCCSKQDHDSDYVEPGIHDSPHLSTLNDLTAFWRDEMGLPDTVGTGKVASDKDLFSAVNWKDVFGGDPEARKTLSFHKSETTDPITVRRQWDVDSLIGKAKSLSVLKQGLKLSYPPSRGRNINTNLNVIINSRSLHNTPHFCLGHASGIDWSVYLYFPRLHWKDRRTTYLQRRDLKDFYDNVLHASLLEALSTDILQHYPGNFDHSQRQSSSATVESVWDRLHSRLHMHFDVPGETLATLWFYIHKNANSRALRERFGDVYIVVNAKNTKLSFRASNFEDCRHKFLSRLSSVIDLSEMDLGNLWVDIGLEDTPEERGWVLLLKKNCLDHWRDQFRLDSKGSLGSKSDSFPWWLTRDAQSRRVHPHALHSLKVGGIAFGQRYNLDKERLATSAAKRGALFDEPLLEGLIANQALLEAYIDGHSDLSLGIGKRQAIQDPRLVLNRLKSVFEAMKVRLSTSMTATSSISYGVREEYRVRWDLFSRLCNKSEWSIEDTATDAHRPYWQLRASDVIQFQRWQVNRWIGAVEMLRLRTLSVIPNAPNANYRVHLNDIATSAMLIRCLRTTVNCEDVSRKGELFKKTYESNMTDRHGAKLEKLGLDFETALGKHGMGWLIADLFDWDAFRFREDMLARTSFTHNGIQESFRRRWQDANVSTRHLTTSQRLLELLYNTSDLLDEEDILAKMQKFVIYELIALLIKKLRDSSAIRPDELQGPYAKGYKGFTCDIFRQLTGFPPHLVRLRRRIDQPATGFVDRIRSLLDPTFTTPEGPPIRWKNKNCCRLTGAFYQGIKQLYSNRFGAQQGLARAEEWKQSLALEATRYIWVIPNTSKTQVFTHSQTPGTDSSWRTIKWVTGIHSSYADTYRTLESWDLSPDGASSWTLGREVKKTINFMKGVPFETLEDIRDLEDFLDQADRDKASRITDVDAGHLEVV